MEDKHQKIKGIQKLKLTKENKKKENKSKTNTVKAILQQKSFRFERGRQIKPSKPKEIHLQLNQFHRIDHSNKRGKRCWLCNSLRHLKYNCPKIKLNYYIHFPLFYKNN